MEMRVYLWENVDAEFDICQKKKKGGDSGNLGMSRFVGRTREKIEGKRGMASFLRKCI